MTPFVWGLAGLAVGLVLAKSPARYRWLRGPGFLAGLAVAALALALAGETPRVSGVLLLIGLSAPEAFVSGARVDRAGIGLGAAAAVALAALPGLLLALAALAAIGLAAIESAVHGASSSSTSRT